MTWICYRGIELRPDPDDPAQHRGRILGLFSVVAFVKVFATTSPLAAMVENEKARGAAPLRFDQAVAQLDQPVRMSSGDLIVALLVGFFIYWGWDSGVAVNEESEDPAERPRQGGRRLDRPAGPDLRRRLGSRACRSRAQSS